MPCDTKRGCGELRAVLCLPCALHFQEFTMHVRLYLTLALAPLLLSGPAACAQETTAPASQAAPAAHQDKKGEYTGPATVVELPPTPMLDEEGRQRLDPDGKPMFNAPGQQQRDKKGHPLVYDK